MCCWGLRSGRSGWSCGCASGGALRRSTTPSENRHPELHVALITALGFGVAVAGGLFGIGGPLLSVPLLVVVGVPMLAALGAAQAQSVVIAAVGTLGYLGPGSDLVAAGAAGGRSGARRGRDRLEDRPSCAGPCADTGARGDPDRARSVPRAALSGCPIRSRPTPPGLVALSHARSRCRRAVPCRTCPRP